MIIDTPKTHSEALMEFRVAAARRMLYRHGCDSLTGGHVSARVPGEADAFWVTPFQYFDQTLPEDVSKLGFDMSERGGTSRQRSEALWFHSAIYQARPDVGAIVHTHSYFAKAFSCKAEPLGTYCGEAVPFYNELARQELTVRKRDQIGHDIRQADEEIAVALGSKRALLIPNHGVIVVADSVEKATLLGIMFERAARFHLELHGKGGVEIEA